MLYNSRQLHNPLKLFESFLETDSGGDSGESHLINECRRCKAYAEAESLRRKDRAGNIFLSACYSSELLFSATFLFLFF